MFSNHNISELALLLPRNSAFFELVAGGVADYASSHGYSMTVFHYETEADIAHVVSCNYKGILIWPPHRRWQPVTDFGLRTQYQILFRQAEKSSFDIDSLYADLKELGASREAESDIALIYDNSHWASCDPVQAIMGRDLFRQRYRIEGQERAIDRALLHDRPPTGLADFLMGLRGRRLVVCANSRCAQLVIATARALRMDVPGHLSVVCLADDYTTRLTDISAFEIPFARIGKVGCETLINRLTGRRSEREICYRLELRQRVSTLGRKLARSTVHRATEMIEQMACQGLRVVDVVNALGMTQKTLNRQFKKHLGTTVGHKIRETRVKRAQALLTQTDLPVGAVASQCGFQDPAKFCGFFKRETGWTPSEYRGAQLRASGKTRNDAADGQTLPPHVRPSGVDGMGASGMATGGELTDSSHGPPATHLPNVPNMPSASPIPAPQNPPISPTVSSGSLPHDPASSPMPMAPATNGASVAPMPTGTPNPTDPTATDVPPANADGESHGDAAGVQ